MPHPMSRRQLLGLGAAGTATFLAGCKSGGSSKGKSGPLTMTIFGGDSDVEIYGQRLEIVKKKLPDIEVDLQLVVDDYDRKLQTMIAGRKAPDIMHVSETVHAFSSRNVLQPLDELISSAGLDLDARFGPELGRRYAREGSVWALPDRGGAMALYYNRDIFDDAKMDYPDSSWTHEDLLVAAKDLTVSKGNKISQFGYCAGDWWPWWTSFMYQNGGRLLDGRTATLDTPENRAGLQFYLDLSLKDRVAPTPLDYADMGMGNSSTDALFVQGKVAFFSSGYWFMKSARETKDLRWGAAQIYHGKETAVPGFGNGFAIPRDSERAEDAFAVINALTDVESQELLASTGQDVPANLEAASSPAFLEPDWNTGDDAVDLTSVTPDPSIVYTPPLEPEWQALQSAFSEGMATVWTGERSLDKALPEIQSEWVRTLEQG